jgi:cytidylate kinase
VNSFFFTFDFFNKNMSDNQKKIIIAIDGHSSCGKSTVAKAVAKYLNYIYVDSGAMYRATTLYCLRNNLIVNGVPVKDQLLKHLKKIDVSFRFNHDTEKNETFLNGENIEEEIRQLPVSQNVSHLAKISEVREQMVALQREIGTKKGVVMDGRDIGTVVFPDAELKIFMTASAEVRAKRRHEELIANGQDVSLDEILANVIERDHLDTNREESPLLQAEDALLLDNSDITPSAQLEWVIDKVKQIIP